MNSEQGFTFQLVAWRSGITRFIRSRKLLYAGQG